MKRQPKIGDEAKIVWNDPSYLYEIESVKKAEILIPITSYGVVVRIDGPWVYLAAERLGSGSRLEVRGLTCIHKALIVKYVVFKHKR